MRKLNFVASLLLVGSCGLAMADEVPESFDILPPDGKFEVDGALRFRYSNENPARPGQSGQNAGLDTIILGAKYDSNTFFGSVQWRFYGGAYPYTPPGYTGANAQIGSVNFPQEAYLGYKINKNNSVTAGIIETPFGIGRFWDSTFYEGIGNAMGIQDAFNLGIKWSNVNGPAKFDAALLLGDAGNFVGPYGNDRYSSNISMPGYQVGPNIQNLGGTNNIEKQSIVARYTYEISAGGFKHTPGISTWYGLIKNTTTNSMGDRLYASLFDSIKYGQWNSKLAVTPMMIRPKNPDVVGNNVVTMGGYDGSYNMATKGIQSSFDLSYTFSKNLGPVSGITPYFNYSRYDKSTAGFLATQRYISGVSLSWGKVFTAVEYRLGKNDPYTNPYYNYEQGLGKGGSNSWDKTLYANIGYYF